MNRRSLAFFVVAISALSAVTATATAATVHRSQIRIRDPFVLPDPATQTYFIYSSTDWGSEAEQQTQGGDRLSQQGPRKLGNADAGLRSAGRTLGPRIHLGARSASLTTASTTSSSRSPRRTCCPRPTGPSTEPQTRHRNPRRRPARGTVSRPSPIRPQTPHDWMSLDGTLWVEDGVPYMVFCHEWIQITDGSMELVRLKDDLSAPVGEPGNCSTRRRRPGRDAAATWASCLKANVITPPSRTAPGCTGRRTAS